MLFQVLAVARAEPFKGLLTARAQRRMRGWLCGGVSCGLGATFAHAFFRGKYRTCKGANDEPDHPAVLSRDYV